MNMIIILASTRIDIEIQDVSKNEWGKLEEIQELSNPLESGTKMLSGDTYATASILIPTIKSIVEQISMEMRACLVKNSN
jgi:hypothetical protein